MTTDERRVRDIGEFGLIDELRAALPGAVRGGGQIELGIGDDAAVWRPSPDVQCVVTTDTLVDEVHFRLDWTDWRSLGHKALAVNLSDCAAMGAHPVLATVSLGLTGDERVADLRAMYGGLGDLAAAHAVTVAGGDIVRSPHALTITVSVIGECRAGPPLRRDGARAGDLIAVSGTLGASAAGLRLLTANGAAHGAATADLLIATHLRPQPRLTLGRLLVTHGATAAMDLSDGLYGDLPKLLRASGATGNVDARTIPVASSVRALFPLDWLELGTRGGEDYELLFTIPGPRWSALNRAVNEIGATLTAIGTVTAPASSAPLLTVVGLDGRTAPIDVEAFDHFGSEDSSSSA